MSALMLNLTRNSPRTACHYCCCILTGACRYVVEHEQHSRRLCLNTTSVCRSAQGRVGGGSFDNAICGQDSTPRQCIVWSRCFVSCAGWLQVLCTKPLQCFKSNNVFVQVDQWLDFSDAIVSGAGLEAVCGVVDQFLSLRTYFVGYQLSIADLQVWGQLQGVHSNAFGLC